MLDGVMLLWFLLTALSLLFVAVDIRSTPESPVLKWGFLLLTAYTGPLGAFLYVLGCREPLPGLHERYVSVRWRQVLGSTMHCVAGDGVGILAGAVIASLFHLPKVADIALEYALGFVFGWSIFQALFMRDMTGGGGESMHGHDMSVKGAGTMQPKSKSPMDGHVKSISTGVLTWMTILSCVIFGLGLFIAIIFGGL